MTAGRSVECSNEGFPVFCIEREDAPIGQSFLGFAQCCFENKFADGLTRRRRRSLQCLFGRLAKPQIKFFGSIGILSSHSKILPKPPDNVKTNYLKLLLLDKMVKHYRKKKLGELQTKTGNETPQMEIDLIRERLNRLKEALR